MTFTGWRLAFKMQRIELLVLLIVAVLLAVASVLIAWGTTEARADFLACMDRVGPGGDCSPTDPSLNDYSLWGGFAKLGALLTPFALGLLLGVPVIAREIEGRTAPIAWTLSRSRARWLAQRVTPLVLTVILTAAVVGVAGEYLVRSNPFADWVDPGFADYGSRGVLLPVRTLAVLSLAVAIGAMVPRQLPALLLAGAATLALFVGLALGTDAWMRAEAEAIEETVQLELTGLRVFDSGFRVDATGEVLTMNDYFNRYGFPEGEEFVIPDGFTGVVIGIPGERYGLWVLRESAVLGALAAASTGLALLVVNRRRPG